VAVEQKQQEEEEVERQRVAEEMVAKLQDRWEALRVARHTAIHEFRAKTLSKEGLKARNAELEAEACAIDKEEREEVKRYGAEMGGDGGRGAGGGGFS
jgi:methylthioribose-1-phosphate isomerase